jgi:hypothetical protein
MFQLKITNNPPIQNIINGTLTSQNAMPQKDSTSVNEASFVIGRQDYKKTYSNGQNLVNTNKKLYGNRDASQITANRRISEIGRGFFNKAGQPIAFETKNDINVRRDALIRTRNAGYVTTPKIRNKPENGLTPSWPQAPLVRTEARAAVAVLNFPMWKSKGNRVCDVALYGECENKSLYPNPVIYH